MKLVKSYESTLEKQAHFRSHVIFNARCKRTGVLPPSLRIRPPILTNRGWEIAQRAGRQFLNERLRLANFKLRQLEEDRKWTELGLRRTLSSTDFNQVKKINEEQAQRVFLDVRNQQMEKFERFRRQSQGSDKTQVDQGKKGCWVMNLSKHQLTEAEEEVLRRGLNFAEAPRVIPRSEIIVGVEAALRKCKEEDKADRARATIAGILKRAPRPIPNVTPDERAAVTSLRKNTDITILPADKGNTTVIMDTTEYEEKVLAILSKNPFRQLNKDPTRTNERRVNETLKRLLAKGDIDDKLAARVKVSLNGTRPPLFYGSVKIHKPEKPLRPIVSAVGSATYRLAKYLSQLLSPLQRETRSLIVNTSDFINQLKDVRIEEDEELVSFDVKSLFTSVPVPSALDAIQETLDENAGFVESCGITTKTILELLRVCLATTSFRFRNRHYELADGLAMGSPVSPIVANLFMAKLENRALTTFASPPKVWLRYVDDVFSIVLKQTVDNLLRHLNEQHSSIAFTVEREQNNHLPFMDVAVLRHGNKLLTEVYRKPTHTGRYLSFQSNHPPSAKRSVIAALMNRKAYITTGESATEAEDIRIRSELATNHYPSSFIEHAINNKNNPKTTSEEHVATAIIPYCQGTSEAIRRVLASINIRTVMKPRQLKWTLMKGAKDDIQACDDPGVVYAIGCNDCAHVYVGETARTATQRTREHKTHTNGSTPHLSAVAMHAREKEHHIYWTPRVLTKEADATKRKLKEALLIGKIRRTGRSMNQDKGLEVSKLWLDLI